MTDAQIIQLVLSRTKAGAEALYDRYSRGLWFVIRRMVPDKRTAETVFEKTFIAIWNDMPLYQVPAENLFTFMVRIARQQASLAATSPQTGGDNQRRPGQFEDGQDGHNRPGSAKPAI